MKTQMTVTEFKNFLANAAAAVRNNENPYAKSRLECELIAKAWIQASKHAIMFDLDITTDLHGSADYKKASKENYLVVENNSITKIVFKGIEVIAENNTDFKDNGFLIQIANPQYQSKTGKWSSPKTWVKKTENGFIMGLWQFELKA